MAKKTSKPAKALKKPVKKATAKPAAKKVAKKAAPKAAPAKKAAAAKPAAKKVAKTQPAKVPAAKVPAAKAAAAKAPAKSPGKDLLKAVGKAIAGVAKKVTEKTAEKTTDKPATDKKATKAAPAGKVVKEAKGKLAEVEEPVLEAPADEEELVDEEIVLTDAEGRRYCRVKDCDQLSAVDGYCRYHYLALWKKIQVRKKILSEGKLERYIEELTARYPDKFLEMLRKDLRSEKEFLAAIQELEIDENADNSEFEDEAQNYIDEVRGMEPAARDDEDF